MIEGIHNLLIRHPSWFYLSKLGHIIKERNSTCIVLYCGERFYQLDQVSGRIIDEGQMKERQVKVCSKCQGNSRLACNMT